MIAPGLIVVRFAGTGVRQYHELAFKIPRSDGSLDRGIYIDREIECAPDIFCVQQLGRLMSTPC